MKKVKMNRVRTTKTTEQVDVTLPAYQKHDMMADDYTSVSYERVAEDLSGFEIHVTDYPGWYGTSEEKRIEITLSRHASPLIDGADRLAGVGPSTREEFRAVLVTTKDLLEKLLAEIDAEQ